MDKISRETKRARWVEHVEQWRCSGLTQQSYCHQHGLVLQTFCTWVSRVRKAADNEPALTIVPVMIETTDDTQCNSTLSLQHRNGWHIQLPQNVSAQWLGHILKSLT